MSEKGFEEPTVPGGDNTGDQADQAYTVVGTRTRKPSIMTTSKNRNVNSHKNPGKQFD